MDRQVPASCGHSETANVDDRLVSVTAVVSLRGEPDERSDDDQGPEPSHLDSVLVQDAVLLDQVVGGVKFDSRFDEGEDGDEDEVEESNLTSIDEQDLPSDL